MSDDTQQSVSYDYDESAASHAEDFAKRINENGPFVGVFKRAWAVVSAQKGTHGVHYEFDSDGSTASFDHWTMNKDKTEKFVGYNMLMALRSLLNIKGNLVSVKGPIEVFEEGKRVEAVGDTFPELTGKRVGVIFQKELYTRNDGKEGTRVNAIAFFHPDSKLTASEIREGKKTPAKYERIVKGLKSKDSRTVQVAEPAQPGQGLPATGDF